MPRRVQVISRVLPGALALVLLAGLATPAALAAEPEKVAVLIGFGQSEPLDPQLVPVMAQLEWRLPDPIDATLARADLRLRWFLEVWAAAIHAQPSAFEVGVNPIGFEIAWDAGQRVVPFAQGAIGLLVTNLEGYRTGGALEFDETFGLGFDIFLTPDIALSLTGRYRHMSNAGIYEDNRGLDTFYGLVGIAFHFGRE